MRLQIADWCSTRARGFLGLIKRRVSRVFGANGRSYSERVKSELLTYDHCVDVHALPDIFHYWSNKFLRPKLERCGFSNPDEFFVLYCERALSSSPRWGRIVSVGAGNCDTEVRVAEMLKARGHHDFRIECLDINAHMLARGMDLAKERGVEDLVSFTACDLNQWRDTQPCDAVMANQSLHHVVELEHLFDSIRKALKPSGLFVISDMIGRNGHMRWPEAAAIVREFWSDLPVRYKFNHQLRRSEPEFLDWDCSIDGFEGIRAQDILPLLVQRFNFHVFIGFANVIDPFVDRGFGHNFDAKSPTDCAFIDRVHARDDAEIRAGKLTPTHMMAVAHIGEKGAGDVSYFDPAPPAACMRVIP